LTDRTGARQINAPGQQQSFSFAILADVTDAGPNNLDVLAQAVKELNLLSPDLVMTIGDMVQGYCDHKTWNSQWAAFKAVMDRLERPWYPLAGNHDIYWSSNQQRPPGEHESDYEQHVGPLWYAFQHKGCWFIVMYTDEGDPNTGKKSFSDPNAQRFSERQLTWLRGVLEKAKGARHIFVFMHHPRWVTDEYGPQWPTIHKILAESRVSAVFAGHHHILQFDGVRDGIRYYRLGTTGGQINRDLEPDAFHHYLIVTVRGKEFSVSVVKLGSVFAPEDPRFSRSMLLPRTDWRIGPDRTVEYQVQIPPVGDLQPVLQVALGHSFDTHGDRGLELQIIDQEKTVILRRFLSDRRTVWIEQPVRPGACYTIRLLDADTNLDSQPNTGTIAARLRLMPQAPIQ